MKCTCGTQNIFGAKTCKNCGSSLVNGTAEVNLSATPKPHQTAMQQSSNLPTENTTINDSNANPITDEELTFIPYTSNAQFNFFIKGLRKSFDFKTRASRPELWYFMLFQILIIIVLSILWPSLADLAIILFLIPSISVSIRRLHDTGRVWSWILLSLIPVVGLVLIYWLASAGQPEDNEWGTLAN